MNKKIWVIVLTVIFILILIMLNMFLDSQNTEKLELSNNKINNEEESKMEVLKVTSVNFEEEVLKSEKTVLVDFYADWCGPCKMLSPVVEAIASENEDIKVVKVNVDDEQDLAIKYQVMSIPTLVVIKNGEVVNKSVGLVSKSQVLDLVK